MPKPQSASLAFRLAPCDASSEDGAREGDRLEALLARFAVLIRRTARSYGVDFVDLDEVLQDVRVRLWRAGANDQPLDTLGAAYIKRVAASAAVDLLRQRRRRREVSLDELAGLVDVQSQLQVVAEDDAPDFDMSPRLELALANLPRNRRLVVQLHLEGFSRIEIAGLTAWTEPSVRNLLYRGLGELRDELRFPGARTRRTVTRYHSRPKGF